MFNQFSGTQVVNFTHKTKKMLDVFFLRSFIAQKGQGQVGHIALWDTVFYKVCCASQIIAMWSIIPDLFFFFLLHRHKDSEV